MSKQWFCVVSHTNRERWAKRELENQQFEVYLPLCFRDWERRMPSIRPFLPSYLFVRVDLDDRNVRWRSIYSTVGVRSVLTSGDKPQPVGDWIIDGIKEREVDGLVRLPPKMQSRFRKGDGVRIKGNALDMVFDEPLDHRRAAVFLSLLGRSHRIVVPFSKLVAASAGAVA